MEAYRRLAAASSDNEVAAVVEELNDRYGPLPEPARRLVAVARLRLLCRDSGITEVSAPSAATVRLAPMTLPDSAQVRLKRMYPGRITVRRRLPCRSRFHVPAVSVRRASEMSNWCRWSPTW
ncbi:TRCF domain protein [Mycobacterium kansasii 824]|nr:TRCF domain protein [Mycobacterium kansasii 824]